MRVLPDDRGDVELASESARERPLNLLGSATFSSPE